VFNRFGKNIKPIPKNAPLIESIKQTCRDKVWLVVGASALLSAVCSGFVNGIGGLVEGISIIVAALILIAITSVADWIKDKRFISLQSLIKEETVAVIRGKFGATQSVSVWDLVVGDVVLFDTGANIPCDCLVLEAYDLKVRDGEDVMPKHPMINDGVDHDPFLRRESNIVNGQCKALVCCVGSASSNFNSEENKLETDENTDLQNKLQNLSNYFTFLGLIGAAAIFALMLVRLILELIAIDPNTSDKSVGGVLIDKLTGHINLIVVLVVVSIPEGLPLTIGVSLAFSVMKMYSEGILVRRLEAPEKMGMVDEILVGKTSTITKSDMKVTQFYCEEKHIRANRPDTLLNCEISDEALIRIKESILYNCDARIEMDATTYVPVGDGTEVGLLKFLQNADIPVHILI
jgi:P-type Ca2+ transporter type 2C